MTTTDMTQAEARRNMAVLVVADQMPEPEALTGGSSGLSDAVLALESEGLAEIRDGLWRLTSAGMAYLAAMNQDTVLTYVLFALENGILGGNVGTALMLAASNVTPDDLADGEELPPIILSTDLRY